MDDESIIAMTAIAPHTFAGAAYQTGDAYDVAGDGSQTAAQYADTLTALQFAKRTPRTDGKRINTEPAGYKTTEVETKRTTAMRASASPKKK